MFLGTREGLFSAIGRIGGSKVAPRGLGRPGFFVQEDNVAVEFNIPPATTVQEFVDSIQWSVKTISDEVRSMNLEPRFEAAALFPEKELQCPEAKAFGCDPDYNAWTGGSVNPRPAHVNPRLRSCGGHIHVGYPYDASIDKLRLIQLMDLYLGVPSVMMDDGEASAERRALYGRAGAYRPTEYGVEYRVLSNFWITRPEYIEWAFTQTQRAVDVALKYGKPRNGEVAEGLRDGVREDWYYFIEKEDLCDDIQNAINSGNPIIAQKLVAHHNLEVVV